MTKQYCDRCAADTTGGIVTGVVVVTNLIAGRLPYVRLLRADHYDSDEPKETSQTARWLELCATCYGALQAWAKP